MLHYITYYTIAASYVILYHIVLYCVSYFLLYYTVFNYIMYSYYVILHYNCHILLYHIIDFILYYTLSQHIVSYSTYINSYYINTWIINYHYEKSLTTRDHHGIKSSLQQDVPSKTLQPAADASSVKWMETTWEEVPGGAVISSCGRILLREFLGLPS